MKALNLFDFYEKVLIPLTPSPTVCRIIDLVMSGAETNDDFAQSLAMDPELQHWVRVTVQRLGFDKKVSKMAQITVLLGQNRVRDLILGRAIERSYVPDNKTIRAKMLEELEKSKAKDNKNKPAKTPSKKEDASQSTAAEEGDASATEIIPKIDDFKSYLSFAIRAEEVAISIRNSYPGQAFGGGVVFDFVSGFLSTKDLSQLTESKIKNGRAYLEEIFADGIRCGIAANEIMQKISISHQKNAFVTALVHNVGKALLLAYDPLAFERTFKESTGSKSKDRVDSAEAESHEFELDHAQVGSLYIGRLPFLAEIERSIDYHHNPGLLRFSNPKLYALACVLRVSGAWAKMYQQARAESPDIDSIRDQRLTNSKDFQFLQLTEADWKDIKGNYALQLMKVGY